MSSYTPTPKMSVYDVDEDDEGCIRLHVNTDEKYNTQRHAADIADRIDSLIAAAPELLEALKRIAFEPMFEAEASDRKILDGVVEIARAAITKAEGK